MRTVYTPEHIQFIEENIKGRSLADLTNLFNRRFRSSMTAGSIKGAVQRHGLKSGYKAKSCWNKKYFGKHISFLEKNVPGRHYSETAERFNRRFGFSTTAKQLGGLCKRLGIQTGFTGHFPKGIVPHNKGRKGYCSPGSEKGWFSIGHGGTNTRPVGSERISRDGYVEVKITGQKCRDARTRQRNWKHKHVVMWEKANGPVPPGHVVVFLDGNRLNIVPNNLMMLSRQEHRVMCRMNWYTNDREATKANCLIAKIRAVTANLKRKTFKAVKNKKINFLDKNGHKVYVIQDKNRWIPVRETAAGDLIRLRAKKLKPGASRGEAQRDLHEYAAYRGWMRI